MTISPIEPEKIITSLAVSDYFAEVIENKNKIYYINLNFNIGTADIVNSSKIISSNNKVATLKIKVYVKKAYELAIQQNNNTNFLTKGLNAFISMQRINAAKILEEKIDLKFLLDRTDLTAKRRVLVNIDGKRLKDTISARPLSSTNFLTPRDNNLLIIKNKLDPAEAIQLDSEDVSRRRFSNVDEAVNHLKNHYITDSVNSLLKDNERSIVADSNRLQQTLFINKLISIPERYKNEELEIFFELYPSTDPNSLIYKEVKKTFYICNLLSIKNSIIKKPSIQESNTTRGLSGLSIKQLDKKASGIQVFKKTINSNGQVSKYKSFFRERNFMMNNEQEIREANSQSEIQIFRCVAYADDSSSKTLSAYRNVIIGTIPLIDQTIILISDVQEEKAVKITITNYPHEVSIFQVSRRKILKDSFGSFEEYKVIQHVVDIQQQQTVLDKDVINGEYYEYSIAYMDNRGNRRQSVSKIHKFVDSSNLKSIAATISDYTLTTSITENPGPVITFSIQHVINQESTSLISNVISQAGLGENFKQEFEKIKDKFKDIVFFKVTRINLSISPSIEETFNDIITNEPFIDSPETRHNSNISNIDLNHDYLYTVRGYYKNPASLMKDLVITVPANVTSRGTTKAYKYRPYKWLQQKVLNSGTLLPEDSNNNLLHASIFEDGDIGVVANIKIDKLETLLELKSATARRVAIKTIFVSWMIESSIDEYDHFVIVKESNGGKRKILTTSRDLMYVDEIRLTDAGTIIYYITPVYNDYTVGTTIRTNSIIVDPEELDSALAVVPTSL